MSEKILLAEIRDLYSSNNCEDVIERSIKKIYKILKRSDINSAFKNSFRKKVDIPIHKIFKDRIEYFTTDYIDTLTNAYTILFILTKYLRYLENDDLKYNVIHSESTTLFTIFEFIKENGISLTEIVKDIINGDLDVSSTLIENSTSTQNNLNADSNLAQNSSTNAEASYNAVSYVNIQLLLDKIEKNIQKGYKFRNIDIARYRNIYFKEIVNNCKAENLPKTTIDGYAKVLNSLLDDMYDAELESAISESSAALVTLQSLTQIDGIQKDSIQDFCVNRSQDGSQEVTEFANDSKSTDDTASDN